jgi:hypothetical protein
VEVLGLGDEHFLDLVGMKGGVILERPEALINEVAVAGPQVCVEAEGITADPTHTAIPDVPTGGWARRISLGHQNAS